MCVNAPQLFTGSALNTKLALNANASYVGAGEREEFALNLSGAGVNLSATLQTPANFDILPINHPNIYKQHLTRATVCIQISNRLKLLVFK
jgi:hypothetical protein